jgi:hypothetical protein
MLGLDITLVIVIAAAFALLSLAKFGFDFAASRLPPEKARLLRFPSPLSLLMAALLFVVLLISVMFLPSYMSHMFPECRFLKGLRSQSLLDLLLYLGASLTIAWLIARFQREMWQFNGFGTKMYTSDPDTAHARVGTKWLVALFVPILPVRSYEVFAEREFAWDSKEFDTRPLDSIQWDQVKYTIRMNWWIYSLFMLGIIALVVFSGSPCL